MARLSFTIGTQGEGPGQGVWQAELERETGLLRTPRLAAEIDRPTWLLRHPRLAVIYAVSEVGNRDARDGRLHTLSLADGRLEPINDVPARGGGPTDLALDVAGRTLFVANFGGGQVSAIPLDDNGALSARITQCQHVGSGPHKRQTKPHPHGVTIDPTGHWLLAPDMGADRLFLHAFDPATGQLAGAGSRVLELPAGSGPRLVRFGRDGCFAYLLTELSSQLFVFRVTAPGELVQVQILSLDPISYEGDQSAAALELSADGLHLYASNRRTHEMHVFSIDPASGLLEPVQAVASGGERPWSATLSPDGAFLLVCNQASDLVSVFARDAASGRLTPVSGGSISVPSPTCVAFL